MSDLFTRLKQRKIIQWAVAYAGGAWLLLQLLSLLAQPFAWPDLVIRAAVIVLGVGFLAVLVLAWFHGEKGAQKAGGVELLMLGALFIVAASGVALVSRSLRVISRTSVMRYKETTLRTPEIARELNAAHLWANTYDRKLTNIFEIQVVASPCAAFCRHRSWTEILRLASGNPSELSAAAASRRVEACARPGRSSDR